MKKGFTLIEVSILFVIFLIVALLVIPLSVDDTKKAKNIMIWKNVQQDFANIFNAINSYEQNQDDSIMPVLSSVLDNSIKDNIETYKITFLNGTFPNPEYRFVDYKLTQSNAVMAIKFFDEPNENQIGLLMYDVNGKKGPNVWGKDVFGYTVYKNKFVPFGKDKIISEQKQDCSKRGTGLYCSNYYLIGGNFDK